MIMTKEIDLEAFRKAWLSLEEIESVKMWIEDVENWNIVPYEEVKLMARKKIFSKSKIYA